MSDDIVYEDCDEDGFSKPVKQPEWKNVGNAEEQPLIRKAFAICGRKNFADAREFKDWKKVTKALNRGAMSREWVESCIAWAATKNEKIIAIRFRILLSLILNIEKQLDWEAQNLKSADEIESLQIKGAPNEWKIE